MGAERRRFASRPTARWVVVATAAAATPFAAVKIGKLVFRGGPAIVGGAARAIRLLAKPPRSTEYLGPLTLWQRINRRLLPWRSTSWFAALLRPNPAWLVALPAAGMAAAMAGPQLAQGWQKTRALLGRGKKDAALGALSVVSLTIVMDACRRNLPCGMPFVALVKAYVGLACAMAVPCIVKPSAWAGQVVKPTLGAACMFVTQTAALLMYSSWDESIVQMGAARACLGTGAVLAAVAVEAWAMLLYGRRPIMHAGQVLMRQVERAARFIYHNLGFREPLQAVGSQVQRVTAPVTHATTSAAKHVPAAAVVAASFSGCAAKHAARATGRAATAAGNGVRRGTITVAKAAKAVPRHVPAAAMGAASISARGAKHAARATGRAATAAGKGVRGGTTAVAKAAKADVKAARKKKGWRTFFAAVGGALVGALVVAGIAAAIGFGGPLVLALGGCACAAGATAAAGAAGGAGAAGLAGLAAAAAAAGMAGLAGMAAGGAGGAAGAAGSIFKKIWDGAKKAVEWFNTANETAENVKKLIPKEDKKCCEAKTEESSAPGGKGTEEDPAPGGGTAPANPDGRGISAMGLAAVLPGAAKEGSRAVGNAARGAAQNISTAAAGAGAAALSALSAGARRAASVVGVARGMTLGAVRATVYGVKGAFRSPTPISMVALYGICLVFRIPAQTTLMPFLPAALVTAAVAGMHFQVSPGSARHAAFLEQFARRLYTWPTLLNQSVLAGTKATAGKLQAGAQRLKGGAMFIAGKASRGLAAPKRAVVAGYRKLGAGGPLLGCAALLYCMYPVAFVMALVRNQFHASTFAAVRLSVLMPVCSAISAAAMGLSSAAAAWARGSRLPWTFIRSAGFVWGFWLVHTVQGLALGLKGATPASTSLFSLGVCQALIAPMFVPAMVRMVIGVRLGGLAPVLSSTFLALLWWRQLTVGRLLIQGLWPKAREPLAKSARVSMGIIRASSTLIIRRPRPVSCGTGMLTRTIDMSGSTGTTVIGGLDGTTVLGGLAGIADTSGLAGSAGISGLAGIADTSGLAGSAGISGLAGIACTSGLAGIAGISGLAGIADTSGLAGIAGISGLAGIAGTSGLAGIAGISGLAGIADTSGLAGIAGISGLAGIAGISGLAGMAG